MVWLAADEAADAEGGTVKLQEGLTRADWWKGSATGQLTGVGNRCVVTTQTILSFLNTVIHDKID